MIKRREYIFWKLLLYYVISGVVLIVVLLGLSVLLQVHRQKEQQEQSMKLIAQHLTIAGVDPVVSALAYDRLPDLLHEVLQMSPHVVSIGIYDLTGALLLQEGMSTVQGLSVEEMKVLYSNYRKQGNVYYVEDELYVWLFNNGQVLGVARIELSNKYLNRRIAKNVLLLVGIGLVLLTLSINAFYMYLYAKLGRPLAFLTKYIRAYQKRKMENTTGELLEVIKIHRRNEIGKLMIALKNLIRKEEYAKQLIEDERQRLEGIIEGTHAGTWEWNLETGEVRVNKLMAQLLGYGLNELTPFDRAKWKGLIHSEDLPVVEHILHQHILGKLQDYSCEYRMKHRYGEWIWVHDRGKLVRRNDKGEPLWFFGIQQDISLRKKSEQAIHQLQSDLSDVLNSMPSILIGVGEDGTVRYWNKKAVKETNCAAQDVIGKELDDVCVELKEYKLYILDVIKTRRKWEGGRIYSCRNGIHRIEQLTVFPLSEGKPSGAVIRIDDITESVRIEELLLQNEKMLSLGGLAAGMAHEINNPLGGMIQTANVMQNRLLQLDMKANVEAAKKAGGSMKMIARFMEARNIPRMLERIRQSGEQASEIVQNMLSFARRSTDVKAPCNLAEIIDSCIELSSIDYDLKKKYDFRKIEIVRDYETDLPVIFCVEGKLKQVFMNILKNGAEAMWEKKQQLHNVDYKPVFAIRMFWVREGKKIQIEIEDNGPGMTKEVQMHIFEPFYTTKATNKGTGLGLSVAYFVITQTHEGELWVDATPGEGTKFGIKLPINTSRNE